MAQEFHLTLPSNVDSSDYGISNKTSFFTTFLPHLKFKLEGRWKVALTSIIYPCNIFNVTEEMTEFEIMNNVNYYKKKIKEGYYEDGLSLVEAINHEIPWRIKSKLVFFKRNNKINFYMYGNEKFKFHPKLAEMLGLGEHSQIFGSEKNNPESLEKIVTSQIVNVRQPDSMFIYCNIISEVIVGDKYAPLLAVCKLDNEKYLTVVEKTILRPVYISLSCPAITSIVIKICDSTGKLIKFQSGKTILTLHFVKNE